jgi:hypothetical protein
MAQPQQQLEQFQATINPGVPPDRKDETFESRLLTEVQKDYALTRASRPRRYYLWLISALFSKAIHYTHYNQWTGVVQEWSQEKISACMYTPVPLLYYAVENLAAQYTNSNPTIEPLPANDDDPKMKAVLRALKSYADWLDYEFYRKTPHQRQTEVKLIPLRGVYSFLEWDRRGGAKVKLPQYQPQQGMACADCGAEVGDGNGMGSGAVGDSGAASGMAGGGLSGLQDGMGTGAATGAACPECGSPNVQTQTAGIANRGMVEGRQGCVKRHVVDPFQVEIFDRTKGIEESPYLIYDEVIFKTKALKDYPWLKAISGAVSLGNSQEGFLGLHYLMQLETVISNTGRLDQSQPDYMSGLGGAAVSAGYQGSFLHEKLCWRRRVWLDPDEYASDDWVTGKKWTQLPGSPKPVPPDTRARDMFPDGLLVHIINGNQIVKLENQSKNAVWNYVGYRVPAEGLHGAGVNPLVSLNRGYDEANSFEMQALLMSALGIIVADERIKNIRNIPGSIATIPISARMPNESIQSLVARLDMGGGQAISAAEPVKEGFRGAIGDLSMSPSPQGDFNRPRGVGKETATAARYNAGATSTLTGPPLELYAASKAQVITQAVALERLYNQRPRQFGKFGDSVVKWLDPIDIPEDCPFGPAEDSWRPRTLETQREDVMNYSQVVSILAPVGDKPTVDKAKRVFGMDAEISDYEDWAVRGEKRLDALKQALPAVLQELAQEQTIQQQTGQMPDEMEAQDNPQEEGQEPQQAPLSPGQRLIQVAGVTPRPLDMPGHEFSVRFWAEQFTTDEFDSWHPVLQDAVEQMFILHSDGIGQAGAVATDQMVTAQGPAMKAQFEQAAQQTQQEQAGQGSEHAQNMEGMAVEDARSANDHQREMESKRHESREGDKQRRHEREQSNREPKHTVTETKEKTRGAIAVSKSKPKPKPANKRR